MQAVDNDGNAVFEGLELGLYLIVQTEASAGYKAVNPSWFLPMAEDGQWVYDVDASLKVGAYTPETGHAGHAQHPASPDYPDMPTPPDNPDNPDASMSRPPPADTGYPVAGIQTRPGPANPRGLPQTGQLNWPVPVMAVSGVVLFAFAGRWIVGTARYKFHLIY